MSITTVAFYRDSDGSICVIPRNASRALDVFFYTDFERAHREAAQLLRFAVDKRLHVSAFDPRFAIRLHH